MSGRGSGAAAAAGDGALRGDLDTEGGGEAARAGDEGRDAPLAGGGLGVVAEAGRFFGDAATLAAPPTEAGAVSILTDDPTAAILAPRSATVEAGAAASILRGVVSELATAAISGLGGILRLGDGVSTLAGEARLQCGGGADNTGLRDFASGAAMATGVPLPELVAGRTTSGVSGWRAGELAAATCRATAANGPETSVSLSNRSGGISPHIL
jgi:hypothetical protein